MGRKEQYAYRTSLRILFYFRKKFTRQNLGFISTSLLNGTSLEKVAAYKCCSWESG